MSNDKVAAAFHGEDMPIGTPVTYWPGFREGPGIKSITRSNVWHMSGTPVVLVQGRAGGIALTHIELRDLSPEEALRAHVADLLADVDHFTGCHRYVEGDGTCTCFVGRLTRAIGADFSNQTSAAIDVVARAITNQMLCDPREIADQWENYPEIGEGDWNAIVERVRSNADTEKADEAAFHAAYLHLQGRSEAWAAENDGAA